MTRRLIGASLACLAVAFTAAACSSDGGPEAQDVTITFRPQVGAEAFSCAATYTGIGTTGSDVQFTSFKLYVSNVRLVTASGDEETVTLAQDGEWQQANVALLDFENGSGSCEGSTETNFRVVGTVPAGEYSGIKFTMGIPFALNHGDVATAAAPLNSTDMFWVWNYGYKFLRIDFTSTGLPGGFPLHVGSTGCNGATATTPPTSCTAVNDLQVTLDDFDAANDVIVVDPKPVLATTDVDADGGGMPGCMSGEMEAACGTIFPRLGLAIGSTPAATQLLFRVEAE